VTIDESKRIRKQRMNRGGVIKREKIVSGHIRKEYKKHNKSHARKGETTKDEQSRKRLEMGKALR